MPKNNETWTITLDQWVGLCPAYYDNSYPFYGNKSHASETTICDLIDPNVLTQGPGATALTGGSESGELGSELIKAILKHSVASNSTYACSDDKIFNITNTAVANGSFPLSLTAGAANVATDILYYKSKVYIFWNDTGVDGDIAQLTLPSTLDDDWGSTTPTGAAQLEDAPHYGIVGGDDVMYTTNGQYVAKYDGTTLTVQGLDFWTNSQTVSLSWNQNRVKIAVVRPNISGSNFNQSGIYSWNGIAPSWEGDPIEVNGEIGALYTKNGITYVWWKDGISTGGYNLGYVNGAQLSPLKRYKGSLPNQAQVGEYEGMLGWVSSNKLMLWGSKDTDSPVRFFEHMAGQYATIGTWGNPFGTPIISSKNATTGYSLAKATGYSVAARYKTIAFPMSGVDFKSQIDLVMVETEQMATGAKCDFTITYDQGKSTVNGTQVAYSASLPTRHKVFNRGPTVEDFRLDVSWANGSATNPVKIRSIFIKGHYIVDN